MRLGAIKSKTRIVWGLLFTALLIIEFPYFKIPFSENEGMFTCVAQEMSLGAKLYQDVWDHKPPLLFVHFELIENLFGNTEIPFRFYVVLLHCLDAVLLFSLAVRLGLGRKSAWLAAWSYALLLLPPFFQAWTPQAELLMQPFLVVSLCFWLSDNKWAWGLAGILWAVSFFTKPTALFFVPLYPLLKPGEKIKPASFFILGADLAALAVVIRFLLDGRLPLLSYALWGFNKTYVAWGWQSFFGNPVFQHQALHWHGVLLFTYGLPILLALFGLFRNDSPDRPKIPKLHFFILVWFLTAFFTCLTSGFFHPYYYFMIVPPLALGLGISLNEFWERKKIWIFGLAVISVLGLGMPWLQVVRLGMDGITDSDYSENRAVESKQVGLYLKGISHPGDRLLVWATEPQIYTYSGLKMAVVRTPLINHLFKMPSDWAALRDSFMAKPPGYVVISHFDQLILAPEWLLRVLGGSYEKKGTFGHYDLYAFKNNK